ncbi:MAG: hypothetical protein ABI035_08735 [Gemmatimonadaceae bacterium]
MPYQPPLAKSPRLAALLAIVLAFVGVLGLQRVTDQSENWFVAATTALILGCFMYIVRTRTVQFMAYFLASICAIGLIFYAYITVSQGSPSTTSERLAWAGVVAIPFAGLVLAWWILHRHSAKTEAHQNS